MQCKYKYKAVNANMKSKEISKENANPDTAIYSGSVTKLLFALLHSPSTQLESYFTNQQAPFSTEKTIQRRLHYFPTLS